MDEDNENKKPSEKAKEALNAFRAKELMEYPKETLAKLACKQEIEYAKLKKEHESLLKQYKKLQEENFALKNEKKNHKYEGYDKSKELLDKIVFILKRNKSGMSFTEVKDTLLLLEPELRYRWGNVNKSVTHLLSKGCGFGVLIRFKKYGSKGSFLYNLP